MSEFVKSFVDLRKDMVALVQELKKLNSHLDTFEKMVATFESFSKELHETNSNMSSLLALFSELKAT